MTIARSSCFERVDRKPFAGSLFRERGIAALHVACALLCVACTDGQAQPLAKPQVNVERGESAESDAAATHSEAQPGGAAGAYNSAGDSSLGGQTSAGSGGSSSVGSASSSDAGAAVDAGDAGGESADAGAAGACAGDGKEVYGNTVGVTSSVVRHLREVAKRASRSDAVFMKVGDSISSGTGPEGSFGCFSRFQKQSGRARLELAGRMELLSTIEYFDRVELRAHNPASSLTTSWDRNSTAARPSVASDFPLSVDKDSGFVPLYQEIKETNARFAVIMLGTNDVGGSPLAYGLGARGLREYARNFWQITSELEERGIIPVITYIPPVNSSKEPYRKWFSAAYVAVLRGIASARKLPTVDFYSEMAELGSKAYLPSDPLHPNQYPESACIFSEEALSYGHNLRNLRTLEVLDKLRQAFAEPPKVVDTDAEPLCGAGSHSAPYRVPALPFASDVTFSTGENKLQDYAACGGQNGANGNERVFRLQIANPTKMRAVVVPTSGACDPGDSAFTSCDASRDVSISLFRGDPKLERCVKSHSTMVEQYLEPGVWYVVVDSFADAQGTSPAIVSIHTCHPEDPACAERAK